MELPMSVAVGWESFIELPMSVAGGWESFKELLVSAEVISSALQFM